MYFFFSSLIFSLFLGRKTVHRKYRRPARRFDRTAAVFCISVTLIHIGKHNWDIISFSPTVQGIRELRIFFPSNLCTHSTKVDSVCLFPSFSTDRELSKYSGGAGVVHPDRGYLYVFDLLDKKRVFADYQLPGAQYNLIWQISCIYFADNQLDDISRNGQQETE